MTLREKSWLLVRVHGFYGVYDFPTQERHIANVGDVVSLRLTLNNSFDRSCGLNWAVGMMRKVCSNGMCSLVADTNVTKKHSSKLDLSFIKEGIDASVEKFDASVEAFKNLGKREITHEQGGLILDNLAIKKVLSESLRDSIQMVWDSPSFGEDQGRNLYNLYNATTEHLTREVQGLGLNMPIGLIAACSLICHGQKRVRIISPS